MIGLGSDKNIKRSAGRKVYVAGQVSGAHLPLRAQIFRPVHPQITTEVPWLEFDWALSQIRRGGIPADRTSPPLPPSLRQSPSSWWYRQCIYNFLKILACCSRERRLSYPESLKIKASESAQSVWHMELHCNQPAALHLVLYNSCSQRSPQREI